MLEGRVIANQEELIKLLQKFIAKRGWKLKIAKKYPIEQSLFIHTINELGAIKSYLQNFSHPFNDLEIVKLYIASVVHDSEKETDEWQERVYTGEKPPHHTNPEYAEKFLTELLSFLKENGTDIGFSQEDMNDIISSQPLHMKASAKNPVIVFEEITRKHKSERWSEIAQLIYLFDNIVSLESVESSINLLNRDEYRMLNERLEFTYHKIGHVRGILTSLLHKACENVHEKHGFKPFLYYVDGTLYIRARENKSDKLSINEIKESLKNVISKFIHDIDIDNKVVIDNPQTKLFRGREFFDKELIDKYFSNLRRRYRPKIDKVGLKEVIEKKFGSLKKAKEKLNLKEIKDSELINFIIQNTDNYSEKFPDFITEFKKIIDISISKPQQYMFQLFKEIVYDDKIFANEKNFQEGIQEAYNSFFGDGMYRILRSKGTTNPQIDFEQYIKPYWEKEIKIDDKSLKVKKLSIKEQENLLSKELSSILKNNIDKCSKLPKDEFINEIVELLISDLVYPYIIDIKTIGKYAHKQLITIGTSKKKLFNKTKGERLCPVCYSIMSETNLIAATFLSNEKGVAKVFNNQAIGGSSFGSSVNICKLCYAELLLRRVILGKTPSDLVILFPSLNFAKIEGSKVLEDMKNLQNKLGKFFSYHNPDLKVRIQLNNLSNLTTEILEKSAEEISAELNPNKFIESFKILISDETRKKDLKKLKDKIKEEWDSVEDFNKHFNTAYASFEEIAEDVFENGCMHGNIHHFKNIPEPIRNWIIEGAGVNPIKYSIIYETPNFIIIPLPLTFKYNEDEADVNIILKRFLFASYLYLLTNCAVMIIPGKEIIHVPPSRKIVHVQPNATIKQIIKDDWVSLHDLKKWMVAISAAVKLAYEGNYSHRSGTFEVLTQPTVGHILARITSQKTRSGVPKRVDSRLINILDKLQTTEVLKNETVVDTKI